MTERGASRLPLVEAVEAAVAGGVDWVQVRERALPGRELLAHVEAVAAAARRGAAARGGELVIVVNRRVDLVLALGLDGVHLGFDGMEPASARALLGPGAQIGVSVHAAEEAAAAEAAGASYVHLAPIFAPRSKPGTRPPLGPGAIRAARAAGARRIFAQGGVDAGNAAELWRAGAAGLAVTGALLQATDPRAEAARLRRALDAAANSAHAAP